MELSDKVNAVIKMQKFIIANIDQRITLDDLSRIAGYSKYHSARISKELADRTPFEYIRAIRLTIAAQALRDLTAKWSILRWIMDLTPMTVLHGHLRGSLILRRKDTNR